MSDFLSAVRDAVVFVVTVVLMIGIPCLIVLYRDWKRKRGWFDERR